jgi:hypothetical protein
MPAHVSRGTGVHHGRCHRTLERLRLSPSAPDAGAPTAACGLDPFAGTSSGRFRCGRCGCSSSCGCSSCSLDSRGALSSAPPIIAPAPTHSPGHLPQHTARLQHSCSPSAPPCRVLLHPPQRAQRALHLRQHHHADDVEPQPAPAAGGYRYCTAAGAHSLVTAVLIYSNA